MDKITFLLLIAIFASAIFYACKAVALGVNTKKDTVPQAVSFALCFGQSI